MAKLPALPTYIVADVPEPVAGMVRALRGRFDSARAAMPVEATITGSSGLGSVSPGQDLDAIFRVVDSIAAAHAPFDASFKALERFSGADIYYFTFSRPAPFKRLHRAFASSSIKFEPSPFPYKPHCTLKLRKEPCDEELFELFELKPPAGCFQVERLSVYMLPSPSSCELLHSVALGGG